jgi:hypothetical protein
MTNRKFDKKTPEEYMAEVNQYWAGKTKPASNFKPVNATPEERRQASLRAIETIKKIRTLLDRIKLEMEEDNGKIYD